MRHKEVIEAEVKFGYFLGAHHLAFLLADHCTRFFRSMFPDSTIAKDFKCGRTKATAILKVIAQDVQRKLLCAVSDSKYFSLQTDETTDIAITQEAAIMLRFFDNSLGKVRCIFFALDKVEKADARHLFDSIDQHFQSSDVLAYDHLVGLGTDGCNVMMGQRNSVMTHIRSKQPALVALHCNCHIAALVANHACAAVMPKKLEELTTDVWYYFHKSAKRMREFARFQCFVEVKPHKLLKACQTSWLSLEACVNCLIEQYDTLLSYFRSTSDNTAAVRRITTVLEKPITKAYLLFLSNALPIINYFNKCMQRQAPLLHVFMEEIEGLVRKLLLRFMKSEYVCELSNVGEASLDDEDKYLPLNEVFVGHSTTQYLEEALEDSLSTTDERTFQKTARSWWYTCSMEAIKRLPLQTKFLANLKWLKPSLQQYNLVNQVLLAADSLPQVIRPEEKAQLQEEYMDFCTSPLTSDIKGIKEVDTYWHAVSQVKDQSESALDILCLQGLPKLSSSFLMEMLTLSAYSVILG